MGRSRTVRQICKMEFIYWFLGLNSWGFASQIFFTVFIMFWITVLTRAIGFGGEARLLPLVFSFGAFQETLSDETIDQLMLHLKCCFYFINSLPRKLLKFYHIPMNLPKVLLSLPICYSVIIVPR